MTGGGNGLAAPLAALTPSGVVAIGDFLTYNAVSNVGSGAQPIVNVTVGAREQKPPAHPASRACARGLTQWIFTGGDTAHPGFSCWTGCGSAAAISCCAATSTRCRLTCCTLDPGNAGASPGTYAKSVDGRDLIPCRLWVEGAVKSLTIDRSIIGPIQTRGGGEIETLTIANSIVQAVGPGPGDHDDHRAWPTSPAARSLVPPAFIGWRRANAFSMT